jgi:hypothetical protein
MRGPPGDVAVGESRDQRGGTMAIGPVQLIVLGFEHSEFHGEIIAERSV